MLLALIKIGKNIWQNMTCKNSNFLTNVFPVSKRTLFETQNNFLLFKEESEIIELI